MASSINAPTTFLPSVSPSSMGGITAKFESQRGGQGYGFEGKEIAPGRMEITSYKGGRKSRRQRKSKNQRKSRQRKSKKQRKSRNHRK